MLPFLRLLLLALSLLPAQATLTPSETVVLFNSADPASQNLAETYAALRGVPADRILGLRMPQKETITRQEFDQFIRTPLIRVFDQRKWWTFKGGSRDAALATSCQVKCLALMRGVPLRIARVTAPEGEVLAKISKVQHNEASVDSELSLLGIRNSPIGGMQRNSYFKKDKPFGKAKLPFLILTGRLDAANPEICERMIMDSLDAEKEGLWGRCYLDLSLKGGSYQMGDQWIEEIARRSLESGIPTILDRQANTLTTNYPMQDAAFYFGWYTTHRNGPFLNPRMKFQRGAVAVHLHSFSASQLRNSARNWSAALLNSGAAATLGNVYEPYLSASHHFDIFFDRLLKGYTLAEAAAMAMPVYSWQGVVLGDPLYRPFAQFKNPGILPKEYRDFKVLRAAHLSFTNAKERLRKVRTAAAKMNSGTLFEALGLEFLEQGQFEEATQFFSSARKAFPDRRDQLRQQLHLIETARRRKLKPAALQLLESSFKAYQDLPESKSLIGLRNILNPPPPKPPQPAK